jgi:hypothetical protein
MSTSVAWSLQVNLGFFAGGDDMVSLTDRFVPRDAFLFDAAHEEGASGGWHSTLSSMYQRSKLL